MNNKKEATRIGILGLAIIAFALTLEGCGKEYKGAPGEKGDKGEQGEAGPQGYGAGVFSESITGLCGEVDGIRVTTFQDKNNNGTQELDETTTSVTSLCNGHNGSNITVTASAPSCGSRGGYTMTVATGAVTSSYPICHGATGPMGPQGIPGLNGLDGHSGSVITPVKFCANDNTAFPEYGLYIDGRLFAVYWGDTPSSHGVTKQAFLAEITPGTYVSTGGNGCTFTIN